MGFEKFSVKTLMGQEFKASSPGQILFERCASFREQCDEEARRHSPSRFGNKITTEQIFGLEDHNDENPGDPQAVLEYFFAECMKDVQVVFILRDGRSCVQSKVARTGQSYELACHRWSYSVVVYEHLRDRHPSAHTLRFEDLLRDPEPTLQAMCDFLDLPFEDVMISGTDNQKMRSEYRQSKIDPSKLRKPTLDSQYLELILDGLSRTGYSD